MSRIQGTNQDICILAGFVVAMLLGSCNEQVNIASDSGRHVDRDISHLTTGETFKGGNSRAWLAANGTAADSNYCSAELKLPLSGEPEWTWEYTAAQFSPLDVRSITHFENRLYITAASPNLACLDARTGRQIFTPPTHIQPRDFNSDGRSYLLNSVFLSSNGKVLLATDFSRNQFLFDVSGRRAVELWNSVRAGRSGAFLIAGDQICLGEDKSIVSRDFNGNLLWEYPALDLQNGNVLGGNGTLFSMNAGRELFANNVSDGSLTWSLLDDNQISSIVADDAVDCLYVTFFNEIIECRDQADGSLRWQYDYSHLLPQERREFLIANANERFNMGDGSPHSYANISNPILIAMPGGPVLLSRFGLAFRLSDLGQLRWINNDLMPIYNGMGFSNAILVEEYYVVPELAEWPFLANMTLPMDREPDWPRYQESKPRIDERIDLMRQEQVQGGQSNPNGRPNTQPPVSEPIQMYFSSLITLDPETGERGSGFELEVRARSICPAGNLVVLEDSGNRFNYYRKPNEQISRRVKAYNWLVPEGDS